MNENTLHRIFDNYIEKFPFLTNEDQDENFKWRAAKDFGPLMDKALEADAAEFADALSKVKKCTSIIIDGGTIQPFQGMIKCAKEEPEKVQQIFRNLYSDDHDDIHAQEKLIEDFYAQSSELLNKYYPKAFRYKQNSHSVSAYLFLYNPGHHYMYKATQCKEFAKYIEFGDDWGTGDNIKLDVFYRMCDELVEQINMYEPLLSVDASRFEGMEDMMYSDTEKHMLAFDIIYCSSVYNLFYGIPLPNQISKVKQQTNANKVIAENLYERYCAAKEKKDRLDEAPEILKSELQPGAEIIHKKFGHGQINSYQNGNIGVLFDGSSESKTLKAYDSFLNNLVSLEKVEANTAVIEAVSYLRRKVSIEVNYKAAKEALAPYKKELEEMGINL